MKTGISMRVVVMVLLVCVVAECASQEPLRSPTNKVQETSSSNYKQKRGVPAITIASNVTNQQIIDKLFVGLNNVRLTVVGNPEAYGIYSGYTSTIPSATSGVILGSGLVSGVPGTAYTGSYHSVAGSFTEVDTYAKMVDPTKNYPDGTLFKFVYDAPANINGIQVQFSFFSEDYPPYADAMGIISNGAQIAFDSKGNPINVNGEFFNNTAMYGDQVGIVIDKGTTILTAKAPITPGSKNNTLYIVVADAADTAYDAYGFVSRISGCSGNCSAGVVVATPITITAVGNLLENACSPAITIGNIAANHGLNITTSASGNATCTFWSDSTCTTAFSTAYSAANRTVYVKCTVAAIQTIEISSTGTPKATGSSPQFTIQTCSQKCNGLASSCTASGACNCKTGVNGTLCTQCLPGYGGSSCTPCTADQYQPSTIAAGGLCSACVSGYTTNNATGQTTCVDKNECVVTPNICNSGYTCTNTVGNYTCIDINECQVSATICNSGYTCTNTVGNYTCTDINECLQTPNICNSGYTCTNTVGNYTCTDINECNTAGTCAAGFSCINTIGNFTCTDINECDNAGQCPSGHTCNNAQGGYDCVDIDECVQSNTTCSKGYTCANTKGSFNCVDINECALNSSSCGSGYTCNNVNGSFNCIDINECLSNTSSCTVYTTCNNTQGSFLCDPIPLYIVSSMTGNLVLEPLGSSYTLGVAVGMKKKVAGKLSQYWKYATDNTIVNAESGLALDLKSGSVVQDTPVILWTKKTDAWALNQRWIYNSNSNMLRSAASNSAVVLDVYHDDPSEGAWVCIYPPVGAGQANQKFTFSK